MLFMSLFVGDLSPDFGKGKWWEEVKCKWDSMGYASSSYGITTIKIEVPSEREKIETEPEDKTRRSLWKDSKEKRENMFEQCINAIG